MSQTASLTIIAICQIIFALVGVGIIIAIFVAVGMIKDLVNRKVDEVLRRVQPVVDQAKSIAEQAKDTAEKVSEKVDAMVTRAEATVDRVGDRVESVSARVEDSVSPQMVTIAGIVSTAVKCAQIYRDIVAAKQTDNGHEPPPAM